jgi:hypothetical protein
VQKALKAAIRRYFAWSDERAITKREMRESEIRRMQFWFPEKFS